MKKSDRQTIIFAIIAFSIAIAIVILQVWISREYL